MARQPIKLRTRLTVWNASDGKCSHCRVDLFTREQCLAADHAWRPAEPTGYTYLRIVTGPRGCPIATELDGPQGHTHRLPHYPANATRRPSDSMPLYTLDHIVPVALGGTNDPSNLQVLCNQCNAKKGTKTDATVREQFANNSRTAPEPFGVRFDT